MQFNLPLWSKNNTQKTRPQRQGFLVGSKEPKFLLIFWFFFLQYKSSGPLASDAPGKLDVLGHYSHPLCMDCTQIGILKKTHKVGLSCLLECKNSMALETKISLQTRTRDSDLQSLKQMPWTRSWNILQFRFIQSGTNSSMQRWYIEFRHVRKGDEKEFKPWSPGQFLGQVSGMAAFWSATQCSSDTYGSHCTIKEYRSNSVANIKQFNIAHYAIFHSVPYIQKNNFSTCLHAFTAEQLFQGDSDGASSLRQW